MISTGCILISVLILGLAYFMYVPDGHTLTSTGSLVASQWINFRVYLRDLFGARTTDSRSSTEKPEDGILTTYESLDDVGVLVHRPVDSEDGVLYPSILYFHGGGWISGSTDEYRGLTFYLSKMSGNIVISVEYRLAPEFPFPTPFDDCLRATLYLLKNPSIFGIRADKITLAGDDVGGNLALSVALNISKDEPRLAKNIRLVGIFYSPLQAFDFNLPSYAKYARQTGVLGKRDIVEQFSLYLFGDTNSTLVEMLMDNLHTTAEQKTSERAEILDMNMLPFSFREYKEPGLTVNVGNEQLSREISHLILDDRVSPMMASADDLQNLPHTYFIAPEVDPVRDESIMLYGALRELDIDKNVHVYYRTEKHGFLTEFRRNDVAKRAISEFIVHLKKISRRH